MRGSILLLSCLALGSVAAKAANQTVYITVSAELRDELIASVTAQWQGNVTNALFAGDRRITVTGKVPGYVPPTLDPITDASAMDRCFVHGFAFGMEGERKDIVRIVDGLNSNIYETNTCGGFVAGSTVPASAFLSGCSTAYGIVKSTVTLRDHGIVEIILPPAPDPGQDKN